MQQHKGKHYLTQADITHADLCVIISYSKKCRIVDETSVMIHHEFSGRHLGMALLHSKAQVELALEKLID